MNDARAMGSLKRRPPACEYRKYKPLFTRAQPPEPPIAPRAPPSRAGAPAAGAPAGRRQPHTAARPCGYAWVWVTGSSPLLRAASPATRRHSGGEAAEKSWCKQWASGHCGQRETGANALAHASAADVLQTLAGVQDASKTRGATQGQQRDALGCHERDTLGCHDGGCPALPTNRLCEGGPQAEDQAKAAWRTRAGATGGGSAASFSWQRIFLMTSPCVMAAMIRSDPC